MPKSKKRRPRDLWCYWCQRVLRDSHERHELSATRDHVLPRSQGGRFKVWACYSCNNRKADMTPAEWAAFRQRHPEWWITHPRQPGRAATL